MQSRELYPGVILPVYFYPGKIRLYSYIELFAMSDSLISCLAFSDGRCIASGTVQEVALALKAAAQRTSGVLPNALIFNAVTSQPLELDLRGTLDEVRARFSAAPDGHGMSGRSRNRRLTTSPMTACPVAVGGRSLAWWRGR